MFLCSLLSFADGFSGSGSGTESDPYRISNPFQLSELRNFLNHYGVYFKLMMDIDLEEYLEDENPSQGWLPVGASSAPFEGILDGNGKTISGLWINRGNTDYVGFFGYTERATIKNLTLKGSSIKGKSNVGLLVGYASSTTISDCICNSSNISGSSYVGGCLGYGYDSYSKIVNVESTSDIEGSGGYVGGIAGKCSYISKCSVNCNAIKGNNYTGGVAGSSETISDCSVTCNTIAGGNYTGGIAGNGTISNSSITCSTIDGSNNTGGIVGSGKSASKSFAHCNIEGIDNVGGVAGESNGNIIGCGFIGDIVSKGNCVGGLSGNQSGGISKSFAIGNIKSSGNTIGGIAGFSSSYSDIDNSYFSGSVSGGEKVGGIVGCKSYNGTVHYNYAKTTLAGKESVGGVCGYVEGYGACLKSNVVIASSIRATAGNVGRIFGKEAGYAEIGDLGTADGNKAYNRAIIIDSGVAKDVIDGRQNGTGVSASTLKLKATYVAMGWDFNDTWTIIETECYPYMKTQTAPPVIKSKVVSGATVVSGRCIDGGEIEIESDGIKQQLISSGYVFSFDVEPLQAGHEVRISAKVEGKEPSYYTTEIVSFLGKGTESDPYQIYTAADLTCVYRYGYYKLMNDIDLTDYIKKYYPTEGWESIGREGSETIHFDGDGHKITGLWTNSTRDNTGLFSCFANGTIKNLTVVTAAGKQIKGGKNTGILIGKIINGTIDNCQVVGTVADGTPVGGVVGLFDGGKISLSQASVTVNTTGESSYVGGLIGEMTSGEIDQCVTQGSITAAGINSYAGGLIGMNHATITNSYSNASVTATYYSAGLVGYNYDVVDKCYATGDIFSSKCGAGVIGYNDGENAVVRNCVAMNNKIDLTYESQQIEQGGRYGMRIVGGYKNGAPTPELNNYALKTMQVSATNGPQKVYDDYENGVAKTATELTNAKTYQEIGWNFADVWFITEGESYPSLRNNPATVSKPDDTPTQLPISVEETLSVSDVSSYKGKTTTFCVNLTNKSTNLCAYQFDLTFPTGITLAKDDNDKFIITKSGRYEDPEQAIQAELLEDNTYRIMCYSLTSMKIVGTSGALLNAMISVDKNQVAGNYKAKIENIIVTTTNGDQMKLNDISFNVEVFKALKGDANGDGEINVADIVEIVKDILHKTTTRFVKFAADVNEDGDVNVTDIVLVANMIMGGETNAARARDESENTYNDVLSLIQNDDQSMSLLLRNECGYVASQFELKLFDGQKLESISLNGERRNGHMLDYYLIGDNTYQVVVYSINNQSYLGNDGELLNIKTSGSGDVEIDNILFVTESFGEKRFSPLHGGDVTGIDVAKAVEPFDIYSVDGRVVRRQAENTKGLQKGVYIIKGKKQVVR